MRAKPKARRARRRRAKDGGHTLPKPRTAADVSELVLQTESPHDAEDVRRYVELAARGERVKHAECLKKEFVFGREHQVWDVVTSRDRFWVVTNPTNLYSHRHFPSADYALSFHVGLMARIGSRDRKLVGDEEEQRSATAWRRLEQASNALDEAKEAEDFQAVGMRCRTIGTINALLAPGRAGAPGPGRALTEDPLSDWPDEGPVIHSGGLLNGFPPLGHLRFF